MEAAFDSDRAIVDMYARPLSGDIELKDQLRLLDRHTFHFWGHKVQLEQVVKWAVQLATHVGRPTW